MIVHGSYSVGQQLVGGLIVFAMKCAAMDLEPLEQVLGDAVFSALESAQLPFKEAAALAGVDESTFRKALRGESYRHVTVVQLLQLPYRFWLFFGPTLMWLVARKHAIEIAETIGARKGA